MTVPVKLRWPSPPLAVQIVALLLAFRARWRIRFIALPRKRQRLIALVIWFVHFLALLALFAWIAPQI